MNVRHIYLLLASVLVFCASNCKLAHCDFADDASNAPYLDGWQSGDNGGSGFSPWSLSFSGDPDELQSIYNGNAHFIDGVDVGPLPNNGLGGPAFALTNSNGANDFAQAHRMLSAPMEAGNTLFVEIDGSALEGEIGIGNLFDLVGADGISRFNITTSNGSMGNHWMTGNSNTQIAAGDAFTLQFTLLENDRYHLTMTDTNGVGFGQFNAMLDGTAGTGIDQIRIASFGTGSSSDGSREMFVNDLRITRSVPEPTAITVLVLLGSACGWRRRFK